VTYLLDTTVLILRERHEEVSRWFAHQVRADNAAICDFVILEYLNGAMSGRHYDDLGEALDALRRVETEPQDWRRAREVHRALAYQTGGGQRAVRIPDLVIAAVGERAQLTLAHYDEDYDRISAVTGQRTHWVAPRGSL
jgi:predicted nucleic acid-binding protein